MSDTRSIAPTLVLEPESAAAKVDGGTWITAGGTGLVIGLILLVGAAAWLWMVARKRGWQLPELPEVPGLRKLTNAQHCERAFEALSKRLGLTVGDRKLVRRLAQVSGVEPVGVLLCPSALARGVETLKRTWNEAEHYPEREIATLSALEAKLRRFG